MSCDSNRAHFFRTLSPVIAPLAGGEAAGQELLDMLYDVAVNQPPPEDQAGQLMARAAFQKLKLRALQAGIDLYPHQSASGLPAPEAVAAWAQVGALLDAVEKGGGTSIPPLAADVQQSLAFETLTDSACLMTPWDVPLRPVVVQAMRHAWATNLAALERTLNLFPTPAGEEYDPFLGAMSAWLADDELAPPDLAAAARQYLVLQEAGGLDDRQRGAWMRVLARASGLGIGGMASNGSGACLKCGEFAAPGGGHRCDPKAQYLARKLVLALAPLMGDPFRAPPDPSANPRLLAEELIAPLLVDNGVPTNNPAPTSPEAALLDAVRESDRLMVERITSQKGFPRTMSELDVDWLRDATRRAPIRFHGKSCIWEDGYLYEIGDFRAHADWGAAQQWGARIVTDTTQALCAIAAADLLRMMSGGPLPLSKLQFSPARRADFFSARSKLSERIEAGDVVKLGCGCALVCRSVEGEKRHLDRVVRCEKPHHQGPTATITAELGKRFLCVSNRLPKFEAPVWPQRMPLAAGGGDVVR